MVNEDDHYVIAQWSVAHLECVSHWLYPFTGARKHALRSIFSSSNIGS